MKITKDALLQRRTELAQLVERANVQAQQGLGRIAEIDALIAHLDAPEPAASPKPKAPRKPRAKKTETPAAQ